MIALAQDWLRSEPSVACRRRFTISRALLRPLSSVQLCCKLSRCSNFRLGLKECVLYIDHQMLRSVLCLLICVYFFRVFPLCLLVSLFYPHNIRSGNKHLLLTPPEFERIRKIPESPRGSRRRTFSVEFKMGKRRKKHGRYIF